MKNDFKEILKKESEKIGVELSNEMLCKFEKYKDLLIEWNEKINLTSIVDEYEIIMKHFIDCLEIVKYIKIGDDIIDVGTGAGFPGIVISIYFEGNVKLTLIDSLNKRIVFLEELKKILGLSNIEIIHGRAEEMAHKEEYREKYDLVVSRAVAPLDILLEYDIPYLKNKGCALLLKSSNLNCEIEESKKALNVLNCKIDKIYDYSYEIKNELFTRKVVKIKKFNNTPIKYPRNYGKIKKCPL